MRDLSSWKVMIAAGLLAISLAAAGCAKTITEGLDDTTLTTRVKTAMLNDPAVGALRIDVSTSNSVVTLSGRVTSQVERDQALALARQVSGVSEVKDALQVVPDAR
jgi:osmotically-inducible protein OsmY